MNRRRWLLLAAPLGAVVVAASVAFAAPAGTGHAGDPELDDPHAERPIAAPELAPTPEPPADDADLQRIRRAELERFFLQVRVADFLAAVAADEAARAATAPAPPPADTATAPPATEVGEAPAAVDDVLACIRAHESDTAGGYTAVSPDGTYRGAYQFLPGTWDATADAAGRPDLVGVDPAGASPADQDAMATHLYSQAGSRPWGGRC